MATSETNRECEPLDFYVPPEITDAKDIEIYKLHRVIDLNTSLIALQQAEITTLKLLLNDAQGNVAE